MINCKFRAAKVRIFWVMNNQNIQNRQKHFFAERKSRNCSICNRQRGRKVNLEEIGRKFSPPRITRIASIVVSKNKIREIRGERKRNLRL